MKKFVLLSAVAALAACSPSETAEEVEVEAPAEAAVSTAADGGPSTGTFKITRADGSVLMEEVRADGTWTSAVEGEEPDSGTWEQKTPDSFCSTPDEEGAKQKCYAESVDENGVWTSIDPDDGEVSTIERVEAES